MDAIIRRASETGAFQTISDPEVSMGVEVYNLCGCRGETRPCKGRTRMAGEVTSSEGGRGIDGIF